jgi:extracellular elastinolytic metalloproteinase
MMRVHDWLYRLGFDEVSGNFQKDNLGRGGVGGDEVLIRIGGPDPGSMRTLPDGRFPVMRLGQIVRDGVERKACFDVDLIAHEFVHGLTNRLIGLDMDGRAGIGGIGQAGALGEGYSDGMSISFSNDGLWAEYVLPGPTGGRSVDYSSSALTFGGYGTRIGIGNRPATGVEFKVGVPAVHPDGEI